MATSKQAGQNKQGNILVQDNDSLEKGLGSAASDRIASKTGDMFYVES